MTEQEPAAAEASWGPSCTSSSRSLGPVDPSWLAKLSAHLGIHPARTVASLLLSIWPGTNIEAVCLREACAFLMQVRLLMCDVTCLNSC